MNTYINEPLTQKLPVFYNFLGGWDFIRSAHQLNKLTVQPRHWRGNEIVVTYKPSNPIYDQDVQTTVYQDGVLVHCTHTDQELEQISYNAGMDDEYGYELAVCQKCGAGWNEDGELLMEGDL